MTTLPRNATGYEAARRRTVWNQVIPASQPDVIVQAGTADDVIAAVRAAKEAGRKVSVRSGGHSWSGNHVREGATLIDLSAMDAIVEVNREAKTAIVEPGAHGTVLLKELMAQDLFFPVGHCVGVGIGGFLLQGGFGWNGRVHGPACQSVIAVDVVTADGELVRADADHHPELFWAARGSGPGFFGVVTRFHLQVYDRPTHIVNCAYIYPPELLEELFEWAVELGPKVPPQMEFNLLPHRAFDGSREVPVAGPIFADTEEEAREIAALLQTCPVLERAKLAFPYVPIDMDGLFGAVHFQYPDNHRYGVDNMWSHAGSDLIPGVKAAFDTLPEGNFSHMLWMTWHPNHPDCPERPDMAFSVEDDTYLALYGVWDDPADDAANSGWAGDNLSKMEHLASGIQLADENLANRPFRFLSDENYARYDEYKAKYDPDDLFHTWWARP
ncbi:MAG: FAD-binding oxidoreductase [Actinomycetes bacterium]